MTLFEHKVFFRGVAQHGRALALGARSRWFESNHPDCTDPFNVSA